MTPKQNCNHFQYIITMWGSFQREDSEIVWEERGGMSEGEDDKGE